MMGPQQYDWSRFAEAKRRYDDIRALNKDGLWPGGRVPEWARERIAEMQRGSKVYIAVSSSVVLPWAADEYIKELEWLVGELE